MIRAILTKYHAWRMKRAVRLEAKAQRQFEKHFTEWEKHYDWKPHTERLVAVLKKEFGKVNDN